MRPRAALAFVLALLLALAGRADALDGEDLVVPTLQRGNLLQLKVPDRGVAGVSVQVLVKTRGGGVESHIIALSPFDAKGAFPQAPGYSMWETTKLFAPQSRRDIERVDFSYVVHRVDGAGQRAPLESKHLYSLSAGLPVVGRNPGRGLDRLDPADVQAAVDRLSQRPPAARFVVLPGSHPHPLHPENELVRGVQAITRAKLAHPERDYFVRFSLYIHDSSPLNAALKAAHRAGVRVEGMTDWSQTGRWPVGDLRGNGIPVHSIVRNGGAGDIRSHHTKIWVMGQTDGRGRILSGTTYDCSFNTEFGSYPANQEGMTVFPGNRDVATVYNHMFEAMKGNAPLRLVVDPAQAKFVLTHPLYPYVTRTGASWGSRQAMDWFIDKAKRRLTLLDYIHSDEAIARRAAGKSHFGARVDVFVNGWKIHNDGGRGSADLLRGLGADVHAVHHAGGGSPLHHKSGVADETWVRGGSLNPGWWSFESDETMYVMRSPALAKQVLAAANRLAHGYKVEEWGGSRPFERLTTRVQFEMELPRGVRVEDVKAVYFAGGGSAEMNGSWVELRPVAGKPRLFRGMRRLPSGFPHQGKPALLLKNGQVVWPRQNDTFFGVLPRSGERQKIRLGFKK